MISRFKDRIIFINQDDRYIDQLKKRKVNFIKHFSTPTMHYPKPEDLDGVIINIPKNIMEIPLTGGSSHSLIKSQWKI